MCLAAAFLILALLPISLSMPASLPIPYSGFKPPPSSMTLQLLNTTLGAVVVPVPGTSTVLLFDPVNDPINARAVTNLIAETQFFIHQQIRAHGASSSIEDSRDYPDGQFKRTLGEGCRLAVIPTTDIELTWGVLGDVIEGLRIWEVDGPVYGAARFMYSHARVIQGFGYFGRGNA